MQKCPHPSGFILGGKAGFISVYEETSEPAEPFLVVREDLYAWYIYMHVLLRMTSTPPMRSAVFCRVILILNVFRLKEKVY